MEMTTAAGQAALLLGSAPAYSSQLSSQVQWPGNYIQS
jgi:hypothetical protein